MQNRILLSLLDCDGVLTSVPFYKLVVSKPYRTVCATRDLTKKLRKALKTSRDDMTKSSDLEDKAAEKKDIIADCLEYCLKVKRLVKQLNEFHGSIEQIQEWDVEKLEQLSETAQQVAADLVAMTYGDEDVPDAVYTDIDHLKLFTNALLRLRSKYEDIEVEKGSIEHLLEKQEETFVYANMEHISHKLDDAGKRAFINNRTNEILQNIQKDYSDDPSFKMTPGAIKYVRNKLNIDNARVHIISSNHQEFIQAVLLHNGFTWDDISRIVIHDFRQMSTDKASTTENIIEYYKHDRAEIGVLTICVEAESDKKDMAAAAERCGIERASINAFHARPGEFDFIAVENAERKPEVTTQSLHTMFGERSKSSSDSDSPRRTPRLGSDDDSE